jgi:hypothetical protein
MVQSLVHAQNDVSNVCVCVHTTRSFIYQRRIVCNRRPLTGNSAIMTATPTPGDIAKCGVLQFRVFINPGSVEYPTAV